MPWGTQALTLLAEPQCHGGLELSAGGGVAAAGGGAVFSCGQAFHRGDPAIDPSPPTVRLATAVAGRKYIVVMADPEA